jgi:antitoxin MazE
MKLLQVMRWGNCLAIRIPADYAYHMGLNDGDQVQVTFTVDGGISIRAARWDRRAFTAELKLVREAMPMTDSVIGALRRRARY